MEIMPSRSPKDLIKHLNNHPRFSSQESDPYQDYLNALATSNKELEAMRSEILYSLKNSLLEPGDKTILEGYLAALTAIEVLHYQVLTNPN